MVAVSDLLRQDGTSELIFVFTPHKLSPVEGEPSRHGNAGRLGFVFFFSWKGKACYQEVVRQKLCWLWSAWL
jgi:hypothetical protein